MNAVLSHNRVATWSEPCRNHMWYDPPFFHFQPDHRPSEKKPSVNEGFCVFGKWAATDEGLAIVEIGVAPSCYVSSIGGQLRRRTSSEIPTRAGVVGINSSALGLIRLIDIRESLHRMWLRMSDPGNGDSDLDSAYLSELRRQAAELTVPPPRKRGRPVDEERKRRRAEHVLASFSAGPRGARQQLVETWDQVSTTDGVGSEIRRLIKSGWLIRNSTDEGPRYLAGPVLIAVQEGDTHGKIHN